MKHLSIFAFGLMLLTVMSCQDTSSPVVLTTKPEGWAVPSKQTMYIYRVTNRIEGDTTVGQLFDTVTIVDTGLVRFGKAGVVETFDGRRSLLYHYESNGDISQLDTSTPNDQWVVYPSGGGQPIVDQTSDVNRPDSTHEHASQRRLFVGKEQLSAIGTAYSSLHVREEAEQSAVNTTSFDSATSSSDYWFIPSIGTYGKLHIQFAQRSTMYSTGYSSDVELIGYYPK